MNPEAITWDAIVVGTGMGGATLGHALAKAGRRVLFVERGLDLRPPAQDRIRDRFADAQSGFRRLAETEQQCLLARGGRSSDSIEDCSAPRRTSFVPYIGCGTGGSSALYGMVLERFFPVDFDRQTTEWPIAYDDLRPWYESAERLFRVRGAADPLRPDEPNALLPAPRFSTAAAAIVHTLTRQGAHPYRLHTACEEVEGCRTCQGYLCGMDCKNDSARICLTPAVEQYGASLLTECAALSLDADRTRVRRLVCLWRGQRIEVRAHAFVLAAGALLTPVLLLNSKSAFWPDGLANRSGLVGRRLMRHAIELYVLTKAPRLATGGMIKEVAFNDLYLCGSDKWGTVQSFGASAPLDYLRNRPGFSVWRLLGPAAPFVWRRYARQPILGAILEDSPSPANCVLPSGAIGSDGRARLSFSYRPGAADLERRRRFRTALAQTLEAFRPIRVSGTTDRDALGHVCGTCRFGDDPATSVLDRWNRAHELENLYVVDGSFFPTSGGTNPALTIAANALRVAHHLHSTMFSRATDSGPIT